METFKTLFFMKVNRLSPANNDIMSSKGNRKFFITNQNETLSEPKKFSILGIPFMIPLLIITKMRPDNINTLILFRYSMI